MPYQINEYDAEVYTKAERKKRNQLLYKYVWDILATRFTLDGKRQTVLQSYETPWIVNACLAALSNLRRVADILVVLEGDKTKMRANFRAEALRLLVDLVEFYKEKGQEQKLKPCPLYS